MSTPDLSRWQRLAPMALLFLVINGGIQFVRENLYALAGAGVGVAFIERLGLREALLGVLVLTLGAILAAVVYHRRFRFRIEDDAIRVRKGLIHKTDLRVRFARIQSVSISQPLYFRPFGLVRFSVETPGAAQTEVTLPGIREGLAGALRDEMARLGPGGAQVRDEVSDAGEDPGLVHAPGPGRLFAHGLVSNQVWVLAGIFAWLLGTLSERLESYLDEYGINAAVRQALEAGLLGVAILVLLSAAGLFLISGLISLVRFHRYTLRDMGDRFLARHGLLDRREQTLRREKLTGVSLKQTAGGRLFGLWYLIGRQATGMEMEARSRRFLVPGLDEGGHQVIDKLLPGVSPAVGLNPISARFRRLFWSRITMVVFVGLVAAWFYAPRAPLVVAAAVTLLALVLYLVHRRWRSWGWVEQDGFCWVQQGLFGRQQDGFTLAMVQQVRVIRSPYLRRHDLATVQFTLPHGAVSIPFIDTATAAELANRALFAAETAVAHRV